ncbi:hypothetical protein [Rhizosaccharibacter radicis]|uniref:Uncharacterized protein n=1 Tax=Rhizosaccharibacter radicis TaxID=2782605 RepID=A0ABT1VSG3_9PROT|nr:hypothetical protein [Acetobacteraceae bacterium KSS12]
MFIPRFCLVTAALTLTTWQAPHAAEPGPGTRNVIRIEGGDDSPMTIITGDDKGVWERTDTREVLTYRDADGQPVHVYSDHPVARARVEAIILHGKETEAAAMKARNRALSDARAARAAAADAETKAMRADRKAASTERQAAEADKAGREADQRTNGQKEGD